MIELTLKATYRRLAVVAHRVISVVEHEDRSCTVVLKDSMYEVREQYHQVIKQLRDTCYGD